MFSSVHYADDGFLLLAPDQHSFEGAVRFFKPALIKGEIQGVDPGVCNAVGIEIPCCPAEVVFSLFDFQKTESDLRGIRQIHRVGIAGGQLERVFLINGALTSAR